MSPTDPRHGTYAGHVAGCRLECCTTAARNYQKRRLYDRYRGYPRTVPAIGAQRRLRALCAIGWTFQDIADRTGLTRQAIHSIHGRPSTITATSHALIARVYDELSATPAPENRYSARQRNLAAARGWEPPCAWEGADIDAPDPEPCDLDKVVVRRILDGDPSLAPTATPAERRAVVAAWPHTGRSLNDLARLTGWKPERYVDRQGAAA